MSEPLPDASSAALPEAPDDALPESLPELEARLSELEAHIAVCQKHIRLLMAEEDPAAGIFRAAPLHAAKQRHMQLRYVRDLCAARLKRAAHGESAL